MLKGSYKGLSVAATTLALASGLVAPSWAEEGIEEVVVTGSYIKGSAEDAELPIDVITSDDLQKMGSPSIIEMVRNLGVTAANLGETNQFTSGGQANEGVATVNLRGLGAARTLVLVNGRRHVGTETAGVDINAFPMNSVGRVEMLKDGAAAVYGSDAIAGVVNFITREGFEGFEIGGSLQDVKGSDGDYTVDAIWGTAGDGWNFMIAGEHGGRGELPIKNRDWALVNTDVNPIAGWSGIGNPGLNVWFAGVTADQNANAVVQFADGSTEEQVLTTNASSATKVFNDPQCANLGALRTGNGQCGFNYGWFDNLIEETESNKVFTEFNMDIGDGHRLHVEALYSDVDLPEWKTSPSYPPQSLYGADRVIPSYHPGLLDFIDHYGLTSAGGAAAITEAQAIAALDVTGLPEGASVIGLVGGADEAAALGRFPTAFTVSRAMGVAGAFLTGEPEAARRHTETARFVVGLDGDLFNGELAYDVSVAWSKRNRDIGGRDMYVERMALALRGFGGPNCTLPAVTRDEDGNIEAISDPVAAGAGANGCEFYNPFSRAIPSSAVNGATNPDYNPDVANSEALLRHLIGQRQWNQTNELLVFQAVFSGETAWDVGGGNVGYAWGIQSRNEYYDSDFNDIADRAVNPCPFVSEASVALGLVSQANLSPNCSSPTGLHAFLAASDEETTERTVYGVFGELAIPLTDALDVQAAVRYEDYGGNVGESVDPKIALSWRATDKLSLRASASTTFRGPPQSLLAGTGTALSYVTPTSAFKAIDTIGNPNLTSESAVSMNIGAIYQDDNLYASIDWWSFTFEDSFVTEGFNSILSAYTANGCIADGATVDSAACNELRSHIFPVAAHANLAATERIAVNIINGAEIKTSGIDVAVRYSTEDLLPGTLGFAIEGTVVNEYDVADQYDISGGVLLAAGRDFLGQLNYNSGPSFTSKPELKVNATVSFETQNHYASLAARYIGDYDDTGAPAAYPWLATIDSQVTLDAHYLFNGVENLTVGLSVLNLTDEDPPAARGDLNYDPFTHNAFGRMIKADVTFRIGQ
ncbi:MAG: TonB-dependent receptor [Proteobacteria bacterium]|nr:TonB-dependent receptor [Pseudomonadota bacterium]